ncbi:16S rRNA (uracil(1498)-N(3))-methyltransferase [Desulfatiferula olefinivorans]
MRRFFISDSAIDGRTATLSGQDARHLKDVLRLSVGDTVCLIDGGGQEHLADITAMEPGVVTLAVRETREGKTESPVHITLAQAYLKDKKMDDLIRPLTELGINRFLPVLSSRCVARPEASKIKARRERWEKIARESLKQCRRSQLPDISEAITLEDLFKSTHADDLNIMFWENAHQPIPTANPAGKSPRRIVLLLGPEGGFSDDEATRARENGFVTATLGPRILRAETAGLTACALAQYLFGDLT